MNYELEYLPIALQDMSAIVSYIAHELDNPIAAENLASEFVEAAERTVQFPYANALYVPPKSLKHEYRKVFVRNYIMFYFVDERSKKVTIARVIYAKRDIGKLL